MIKKILITGAILLLATTASARSCGECSYKEPCKKMEMEGCTTNTYDVFCMKDGAGKAHWFFGNNKSETLDRCTAEIENPFKEDN